jgi:endo-1,4-beta-xylanase
VTATGASFTALGGKAQFEFPAGAVTTPTAFKVSTAGSPAADARLLAGTAIVVEPAVTFTNPVRVRLTYPTALGAEVVVTQLRIARLAESVWQESPVLLVDRSNHLVAGSIAASGTIAVFAPPPSLRGYAQLRGIDIGTEVDPAIMRTDTTYARILAAEYNQVTPGNAMKFGPIHPQPGVYSFADADTLVGFAMQQGMKVHGHVLLWHSQQPGWITAATQTRATLLAALKEHVETVVGRYAGRVTSWDAANETIADDGTGLRKSFWITVVGPDVIDSVFVWAHRRDPAAKLYLNDYNVEGVNRKSDSLFALATRLKAAGVPIDGIGLQAHFQIPNSVPTLAQMSANIARFSAAGFDVRFTELDVRMADGTDNLATQAASYSSSATACLTAPRCKALTTWGFTDKYSWIPAAFPGYGRALPRDANFAPKPAYNSLRDALKQP